MDNTLIATEKDASNGNETHTTTVTCSACGEVISTVVQACSDGDGDGTCDICGGAVSVVCTHESTRVECVSNGDGGHTTRTICTSCGAVVSETTQKHTPGDTTVTANNDGTHTVTATCGSCGDVLSQNIAYCVDNDTDGLCDICGGTIPASGEYEGETYAETLNGKYEYVYGVTDGKLTCAKSDTGTSKLALGKKVASGSSEEIGGSGTAPIPIPAGATKIILVCSDSYTQSVEALVFSGTANDVSAPRTTQAVATDGTKEYSFAVSASMYSYVVFTLSGNYSSFTATTVVSSASVRFE